jgi:cyanophycinase
MGYILLEGGAEFGGMMKAPDQRAMELAGGKESRISIIPAAAAPDENHERAGANGIRWFQDLGAKDVSVLPLIDRSSAGDTAVVEALRQSKLIYLLGGFTHHLGQSLAGSDSQEAMVEALENGAVIAGSSAGAMVLCEFYYNPRADEVVDGLNLVPGACVLPHHNTFGKNWEPRLKQLIPDTCLIGIDEETGMLDDGPLNSWRVYGKGKVTLYRSGKVDAFTSNDSFVLF